MKRLPAALAAVAIAIAVLLVWTAGPPREETWSHQLANELMSPYCPGRALSECPSPQAAELRGWIVEQERAGLSREEVEARLFARFGDELRQAPPAEGLGLLAYAIPAGLTAAGALVLVVFFRHVRVRREDAAAADSTAPPAAPTALDPELMRQVDAELAAAERLD